MGKERILLDIGSSTVKVYQLTKDSPRLLLAQSIPFKKGFDEQTGISQMAKQELYELIAQVKDEHQGALIKTYATALYRKLSTDAKRRFIQEFFEKTGLYFNIIDQDLENFYLQAALIGKYNNTKEQTLLINIGGGSTELTVLRGKKVVEMKNVGIGVGTVLTDFAGINEPISKVSLSEVVTLLKRSLPHLKNRASIAFYTGGELKYMQLADYRLKPNNLFNDNDHPSVIAFKDFVARNKEIFDKVTLSQLEALMPDNPKWMHGARACSALAQAICEKYEVETIIPSNSNLVDGVARQEFRSVVVGGVDSECDKELSKRLVKQGVKILGVGLDYSRDKTSSVVTKDLIEKADALVVCNPNDEVSLGTMAKIDYAKSLGKRIIFTKKPKNSELALLPAEVGL